MREPNNLIVMPLAAVYMQRRFAAGASLFTGKPVSFASLFALPKGFGHYWFGIVELPQPKGQLE